MYLVLLQHLASFSTVDIAVAEMYRMLNNFSSYVKDQIKSLQEKHFGKSQFGTSHH